MNKSKTLLCVDAGNTLVKWCVYQNESLSLSANPQHWSQPTTEFTLNALPCNLDAILLSNVLGPEFEDDLRKHCQALKAELHVLKVNANPHLQSAYDNPALLGQDRWAACLAVVQASDTPVNLVVSFGTATTLDALVKLEAGWQHLGGFIVPGLQTMLNSLHHNTAGLPVANFDMLNAENFEWPRNTLHAMRSGVGLMHLAWVQSRAISLQQTHGQLPAVWFSGGFARQMQSFYPEARLLEHAVFKGLVFDYQAMQKGHT